MGKSGKSGSHAADVASTQPPATVHSLVNEIADELDAGAKQGGVDRAAVMARVNQLALVAAERLHAAATKSGMFELDVAHGSLSRKIAEVERQEARARALADSAAPEGDPWATRTFVLDPALNFEVAELRKTVKRQRVELDEAHESLKAERYNPESATGKELVKKCRLLRNENEALGEKLAEGELQRVTMELAVKRTECKELQVRLDESVELMAQLDDEVRELQDKVVELGGQQQE